MESTTVTSGSEETKNTDTKDVSLEEVTPSSQDSEVLSKDYECSGGTNEEKREEEQNPQAGVIKAGAEVTEGHTEDNEEERDEVKDQGNETVTGEKEDENESSRDADIEKENRKSECEAGNEKDVKKGEENILAREEEKGRDEIELVKEEKKTVKEEEKVKEEDSDSKCLPQETVIESKAKEKGEAQVNKEKNKDKQERAKGKGGASSLSSTPRTTTLSSSRLRSARPSARREAMAKFQQDQTPAVRNFKVQKTSVGLSAGASIKQKILHWCCNKTRKYEGVSIENFSSSWSDGLAFCALVHRFFPTAFDFSSLKASEREKNFTLAFSTAESLAGCCPLLDVSDMLLMGNKPDPFSVFTYVQSLVHHLSKIEKDRKEQEKAKECKNHGDTEEQAKREVEKQGEDEELEKAAEQEQGEEERSGEGDPGEERGETKEDSCPKMETDQNDNVMNSEQTSEA